MAGKSFIVTVQAPKAPCRHTHARVTVGHQGLIGSADCRAWAASRARRRRSRQAATVRTMISTPTPVAR